MAQADFNVANQSFPAARADLNNQLLALATNSSGASAPSTTYPYMQWADTTGGNLYFRNAANSGWNIILSLDGTTHYAQIFKQHADNFALTLQGGNSGGANIELWGPSSAAPNIANYDAAIHTFRSVDGATTFLTVDGATGLTTANNGISGTITRQTAQSASGASGIQFTSIPSWVKQVTLHFSGISLSGTDHFLIRLSTGGTFASTGYNSVSNYTVAGGATGGTNSTAGAVLHAGDPADTLTGSYTFTNITGNTWIGAGLHIDDTDATSVGTEVSKVTLSGTLDGIRILPSGSNTFDAGTINITYSG